MKIKRIIFLLMIFLAIPALCPAQQVKTIQLKNGSVLKGQIVKMQNGIYTIYTTDLGKVDVPADKVLNILSFEQNNNTFPKQNFNLNGNAQIQQMQNKLISDPNLMADIQKLLQDPKIISLLSDKNLIDAVMKFDTNSLQQNESFKKLMDLPEMKNIIKEKTKDLMEGK